MSEYQYYEFQALDRPLGAEDIEALWELPTRARITAVKRLDVITISRGVVFRIKDR